MYVYACAVLPVYACVCLCVFVLFFVFINLLRPDTGFIPIVICVCIDCWIVDIVGISLRPHKGPGRICKGRAGESRTEPGRGD